MARNEEKSQSMLFRFREAQAAELGLTNRKTDRRPRLASSCTTLRECERWRGDLLRDISRKVSKIQDAGLTDYEIRDLNDEINKLMREKGHWEKQIVALGGANYRRAGAMLDEDGKQVPGTRGYKYFGRARELPGVKELFAKKAPVGDEDAVRREIYQKYRNQGPAYYGDLDDADASLLVDDRELEEQDWKAAYERLATNLSLPPGSPAPPFPVTSKPSTSSLLPFSADASLSSTKRAAPDSATDEEGDVAMADDDADASKKAKLSEKENVNAAEDIAAAQTPAPAAQPTSYAALDVLKKEDLVQPTLLSAKEMEKVLLDTRKVMLVEAYGV